MLFYRSLLYTAVTRAKRMLIIVGSEEKIYEMVKNNESSGRYTGLRYFLKRGGINS
jgi:exodeoxyribonuclease V alpha subunit